MDNMPSYRKTISLLLVLIFCLSVTGLIAGYLLLPSIIEKKIQEKVLLNTPVTDFKLAVEKAGLYGLYIADIEAGYTGDTTLSIGSVDIRFSPLNLFERKIKRIVIDELTLFLEFNDGRLSLSGLQNAVSTKTKGPARETIIPVELQELQIKKSILQITVDGEHVSIPFSLTARPGKNAQTSFAAKLQLYPGPEQVTLGADIDLSRKHGNFTISSQGLALEGLAPFIRKITGMDFSGQAVLNGTSEIRLQPVEIVSAGIEISLQPFALTLNEIRVESTSETPKSLPVKLAFDYLNGEIRYLAENIVLTAPAAASLDSSGSLALSEVQLTGDSQFSLAVHQLPSLEIKDHLQLFANVSYIYDRSTGNWHFSLVKNPLSPAEKLRAQYQDALFEIDKPDYKISGKGVDASGNISFSAILPQISIAQNDLQGNGNLLLEGKLHFDPEELKGEMQADFQEGRFELTKDKYVIEDVALSAHLPALPKFRTGANQEFRFNKATFGQLVFTEGRINWQLESADSFYINNSIFQWAGGNIQVNDVRLILGKDEQFITIVCKELDLIEMLQQFGIKNAEGEGSVSGKIPVHLGRNSIKFDNGLLSSKEGEGGRIKIGAFDLLSAGIPKNTPQFAQVDFAAEALKNFNYNWVKLFLNSEGEDFIIQMQLYGEPVQSLPFTYDSSTGQLKRTEDAKQGINQPIRLDVNFRFPLNRFLGYSGKIQDIMEKIK